MIVIADTGPINELILIGEIEILPALYRQVAIPQYSRRTFRRCQARVAGLRSALGRLRQTSFHISREILDRLIAEG